MDEELDVLVLKVRADTQGFAQDIETMRGSLEGPLSAGADRAGRVMERSLSRFIQTGKFGFEDLKRTALGVLDAILQAQLKASGGFGGGSGGGGLSGLLSSVVLAFAGAPGRATGGPVAPGQAYMVGERGPELFVPTASGRIETGMAAGTGRGPVTINVNVTGGAAQSPELMAKSGRQVARAVQRALSRA
ncbi:tail tape measure protein [Pacificimonas sp. WHA3]|uniref:Tail tape measure protein n=1 Tax=Pacificimonas pallii TaxID=2827236 RepID=A0ABS6SA02_9SPHN|nr:tail tape measure protein [Pacificimonas pallii]MBV7255202.1 tail tape measure protein [Pacificimonas pallii]